MMYTRHKHTTSAWLNTHTSYTRIPTAPRLTIQTGNTTSISSPTYNILQLQGKKTLNLKQWPLLNKHSHGPPPPQSLQQTEKQTFTIYTHLLSLGS